MDLQGDEQHFLEEVRRLLTSTGDERIVQKALWVMAERYVRGTDIDIETAWKRSYEQAIARGPECVIIPCDHKTAVAFSRQFIREFAIPRCCHYDGLTLSMYCGAAAPHVADLMQQIRAIVQTHG